METETNKVFDVEGFGEVGLINLRFGVVRILSGQHFDQLEVGQSCVIETRDHKAERITRTK